MISSSALRRFFAPTALLALPLVAATFHPLSAQSSALAAQNSRISEAAPVSDASAQPILAQPITSQPILEKGALATGMRAPINKAVPALLASGKVSRLRDTSSNRTLQLIFNMPLRNEDQLDALLADIYNPFSANYHKYLSPREFDFRFGPTQQDFEALTAWAKAQGFVVKNATSNYRLLTVESSVYLANRVFHVKLADFHDATRNRDFYAPETEPTADLPVAVLGIDGLDNADPPTRHVRKGTAAELGKRRNLVGSGPAGEFLPSDMRAAYYGSGPLTGAGQTVGIFSFDGYLPADLTLYYQQTGMTSSIPVTNVLTGTSTGGCVLYTPCDDGEQILDIVQVQGMAPGLSGILFYENNSSANPELNQMVVDNKAKVISSSWSGGGFGTSSDTYFKQMAAQGQTYLNATGDSGAFNASTYLAPGLDANILNVGGTDLVTNGAGGPWQSETAWAGSGGGFRSTAGQAIPTWQQTAGVITTANKGSTTYRNSPDVAAEANYDNPTAANGLFEGGYGGTSFATPRFAGYLALANQQAIANGGSTLGFINATIYNLGLNANAANYHDITSGSNPSTAGTSTTYTAIAGYDLVTGWGSPNGAGLINSLTGTPFQDFGLTPTSSSLTITRSSSVTDSIAITDYNGFTATPAFTITGLPTGVTGAVAVNSAGTSATLTLTADNTLPFSTSTVTVTGTSGTLTHALTYTLTGQKQAGRDFTLSASAATAVIGGNGVSTITVTETNLPAPVNLTIGALPSGITAAFDTSSTSTTANLTFTVASSVLPGTYSVVVTGTYPTVSLKHSATVLITVVNPGTQVLQNPGFEGGTASPWTLTSSTGNTSYIYCSFATCGIGPNSGTYFLEFDGYGTTHTDTASQTVTIPASASSATLSFFLGYITAETSATAVHDTFTVSYTVNGGTATTLGTFSNVTLRSNNGYSYQKFSLPASVIGQSVTITFTGVENASLYSEFFLDDVNLNVQ